MDENKFSDYVLVIMKNLNLIIILYIAVIMAMGLAGYVQENSALEFLGRIHRLPIEAWKIPVISVSLFCSCLLLMSIRIEGGSALVLKIGLEIIISYVVSYFLGFSYAGIVLLIIADTMKYIPKSKWKISFVVAACMFYLVIDYDLIASKYNIISLETYLGYYRSDARFALLGIKNVLNSLNTFLFLVYMVLLVWIQRNEKERILSLNGQLNEANEELKQANIRLEEYAKETEKMVTTRERNRLAREIHDTLGHALAGIITGIEACTALMDVAPEATKVQLMAIADVARQGMTDVRRSVKALRPDALEKFNLEKALMQTINEMRTATNAEIEYKCTTELNCFNTDEEDVIYRIVQECITNSIRHGKAKRIEIQISREFNILKICIQDNGIGCEDIKRGFGLHHMEERLGMLHGSLSCDGSEGFMVEAQIPIRWGNGEA